MKPRKVRKGDKLSRRAKEMVRIKQRLTALEKRLATLEEYQDWSWFDAPTGTSASRAGQVNRTVGATNPIGK